MELNTLAGENCIKVDSYQKSNVKKSETDDYLFVHYYTTTKL